MNLARHPVAALAALCLLTACGGGGSDEPTSTAPSDIRASGFVQLEGCVLDPREQGIATGVHAFSEDGRLVANASSNAQGIFKLRVPAGQHVRIGLDAPGHETLPLLVGTSNLAIGACFHETT